MNKIEKQLKKDAQNLLPDNGLKENIKREAFGEQQSAKRQRKRLFRLRWRVPHLCLS